MTLHESSPLVRPAAGGISIGRAFIGLWLAWALLLGTAMVLGNAGIDGGHGSSAATAARMASSVALVVTAWWAYGLWRRSAVRTFCLCLAVGMTLGAIGDFFNAGLLNFVGLSDPVLGGIAAFGLGHIAYITGCLALGRRAGLRDRRAMAIAVVAWQLIGLIGWYFVAFAGSEHRAIVWPALPYSLLLAGTAGVASGLALQDRRLWPLAVGGALFLASDLILACGMFRGSIPHLTEWVWLTYGPGQMLIVFSVLSAALVLSSPRQDAAANGSFGKP